MDGSVKNRTRLEGITPRTALDMLREGNRRFLEKRAIDRDHFTHIRETIDSQHPFAIVLGCIDSRVMPSLIFDQGIGDLFVVRIAGNIVNRDILGSMEYACAVSGSRLALVLGHTSCGAVKGAIDNVELGNLTGALAPIKPAIGKVAPGYPGKCSSKDLEFVDRVAEMNVEIALREIREKSPVLLDLLERGEIDLRGAMYDHSSGEVRFM